MTRARIDDRIDGTTQILTLSGIWIQGDAPTNAQLKGSPTQSLIIDAASVQKWDTSLVAFTRNVLHGARAIGLRVDVQLPDGVLRLLTLADAVPRSERRKHPRQEQGVDFNPLARAESVGRALRSQLEFTGALITALAKTLAGQSSMRRVDLIRFCRQAGSEALPIISLTSLLVGMILGYLGAVQLQQFGAGVYVANLVTIGVLREMGPLMTAVIMAGRTGAAYAAQLGTMQVNEEVDAIEILGVSPVEFLIVPRLLGLILMSPLLVIYANLIGIAGGGIVSSGLGISSLQYLIQVEASLSASGLVVGLFKACIFAALIGVAGCRAGIMAARDSEGVGRATTESVVTALVYLIIADAAINILCQLAGI